MGAEDFIKKLEEESGINREEEELLGVENIIKVADLERRLESTKVLLDEKYKLLDEKDKEIKKLKKQLKKK